MALIAFRTDYGDYPPSNLMLPPSSPGAPGPSDYCGAQKLAEGGTSSEDGVVSSSASEKGGPVPYSAETTVYVTRTGRKFHRKGCRYVREGARPIVKKDALKSGYTPCAICKP